MVDIRKILINPVTRVEGHAQITLQLDAQGQVVEARFHVNEFRGFEKFCEGRPFTEMPAITPRICGICPVSHAIASAKAGEQIMSVNVPRPGVLLRRLLHLGQIVSSHALSFFLLSAPDFLLGWDCPPGDRNILGVAARFPDLARRGIRLRKFGQEISQRLTGKKVHALGIVAGGMTAALTPTARHELLEWIPEALATTQEGISLFKEYCERHRDEVNAFARLETLYLSTISQDGALDFYEGALRFIDAEGQVLADQLDPAQYLEYIAEEPLSWSYLKRPFYKPLGPERGTYRVGPLARLNIASHLTTPLAQAEFEQFRALGSGGPVHGSFYYHYARLIEVLHATELIRELLLDPEILSAEIRAGGGRARASGIGCTEAPRGTLFHHYVTDKDGLLTRVNLLIATGQNNPAMNDSILQVAQRYVTGQSVPEAALNRVEAAIRCYDPCLSCSTHAAGTMPLVIELTGPDGAMIQRIAYKL